MNIDLSSFSQLNVIDTCAIDNVLSSNTLYNAAIEANCVFCYTKYVEYEMFFKERKNPNSVSNHIQQRLKKETVLKRFECHSLSIDDLQEVEILANRKKLGIGELSSIAFAKKISQCFLTDDQGARKYGCEILGKSKVQTTPHLLGWLFYNRHLVDGHISIIISEHESNGRSLGTYFMEVYKESLRIRLMGKL